MRKTAFLLMAAFMTLPGMAIAVEATPGKPVCEDAYYRTKDPVCIDAMVDKVTVEKNPYSQKLQDSLDQSDLDHPNAQAGVGFLAVIFTSDPQQKERILKKDTTLYGKGVYVEVLYRAGLMDEAKAYAEANGLQMVLQRYQDRKLPLLAQVKADTRPSDNDLLIGAYIASGNIEYIKNILENYKRAEDGRVSDALRMSLMQGRFGGGLNPKGRPRTLVKALCEKYECKTNVTSFLYTGTLASAYWALQSMGRKDEKIKEEFTSFFENDPRLKKLLEAERIAFSNYITVLALAMAGMAEKNPRLETALSAYENLAPGEAVTNAVMAKEAPPAVAAQPQ